MRFTLNSQHELSHPALKLEAVVKSLQKVEIKLPKSPQFRRWQGVWLTLGVYYKDAVSIPQAVVQNRAKFKSGQRIGDIAQNAIFFENVPTGTRKDLVIFTESETYRMLLKGHAPQSEPLRKWVTEEVLPSK